MFSIKSNPTFVNNEKAIKTFVFRTAPPVNDDEIGRTKIMTN